MPFPDGGFVAAAVRDLASGDWVGQLHRVLPTGERHAGFSAAAAEHRGAIVATPEKKVIFSTHSVRTVSTQTSSAKLLRLDAEGKVDGAFAPRTEFLAVSSLAIQSGNRLVVAGTARQGDGFENLLRLLPNGERDETFRSDILHATVIAVVADAKDRLYVVTMKDVTPPRSPGNDDCPNCGAPYHPQLFEYGLARLTPEGKTETFYEEESANPIQLAGIDARGRLHYRVNDELRYFADEGGVRRTTLAKNVVVAHVGPSGPSYCTRAPRKKPGCFRGEAQQPLPILRSDLPVTAIASTARAVATGRSFAAPQLDSRVIALDLATAKPDEAFNGRAAKAIPGDVFGVTTAAGSRLRGRR